MLFSSPFLSRPMSFTFLLPVLLLQVSAGTSESSTRHITVPNNDGTVSDIVMLSGMENATFIAANVTTQACVDSCSEQVDYHSLFPNGTWPIPVNPMFYERSFDEFCAIERSRLNCIQRQCKTQKVWISGLLLCNSSHNSTLHNTFVSIMNLPGGWQPVEKKSRLRDTIFGMKFSFSSSIKNMPYPKTGYMSFRHVVGSEADCTRAVFKVGPYMGTQFEWPVNILYVLPSVYQNKYVSKPDTITAAMKLNTVCQHLLVYMQAYQSMLKDVGHYEPENWLLQQKLTQLVDFLSTNVISEYARQLWSSAMHYNRTEIVLDSPCFALTRSNFSHSKHRNEAGKAWFRHGQSSVERLQIELEKRLFIGVSNRAWGHSESTLVHHLAWHYFESITDLPLLMVHILQRAMTMTVHSSEELANGLHDRYDPTKTCFTGINEECELYPKQFLKIRHSNRVDSVTDVNCLMPMSCNVKTTAVSGAESSSISEVIVGVELSSYPIDIVSIKIETTNADAYPAAPPEVVIVYRVTTEDANDDYATCTTYCYVKATVVDSGYQVYSNQPTCSKQCTDQQEVRPVYTNFNGGISPPPYRGLLPPPLGYADIDSQGGIRFSSVPFFRQSAKFWYDQHAYDWLTQVTFYHNTTHIFVSDPYAGPTVGVYLFYEGNTTFGDILVDPFQSVLLVQLMQQSATDIIKLNYQRSQENYLLLPTREERISLESCLLLPTLNRSCVSDLQYSIALEWLDNTQPSIVILVYYWYRECFGPDPNVTYLLSLPWPWSGGDCRPLLKCSNAAAVQQELTTNCSRAFRRVRDTTLGLRLDNRFLYFRCYTDYSVTMQKEWRRLELDTCDIVQIKSVEYMKLAEDVKSWNPTALTVIPAPVCAASNNVTAIDEEQFMAKIEIESNMIYQITPYNPSNYQLPLLQCWKANLSISESLERLSLNIHIEFNWINCLNLSRPPVDILLIVNSTNAGKFDVRFQFGASFRSGFDQNQIALYENTAYLITAVADWGNYYKDASCINENCAQVVSQKQIVTGDFAEDATLQPGYLWLIGVLVTVVFVLILLLFGVNLYTYRQRQLRSYRNLTRIPSTALTASDVVLGHGRFGKVVQGTYRNQQKQQVPVAIKRLNSGRCTNADRRRFQEEVLLLSDLNSPYILKAYGICMDSWQVQFVTELVPEGTLLQFLTAEENRNLMQMEEVAVALLHVAKGLKYIHGKGVIHNDLSARNCLIKLKTKRRQRLLERVKIADFGLAKNIQDRYCSPVTNDTDSESRPFSMHTSAPEVYSQRSWSRASDSWQFGCLMFQILRYGAVPWLRQCGTDCGAIAELICERRETPRLPQSSPEGLKALARLCFLFDASLRPQAADIVKGLEIWSSGVKTGVAEATWILNCDEQLEEACFVSVTSDASGNEIIGSFVNLAFVNTT